MAQTKLAGEGKVTVKASPDSLWDALLDPTILTGLIPGAEQVLRPALHRYEAILSYGVGRLRNRYVANLAIDAMHRPFSLDLSGGSSGRLGTGSGIAQVRLEPDGTGGTHVAWRYDGTVSGPVAMAGTKLLGIAGTQFIDRFFVRLSQRASETTG